MAPSPASSTTGSIICRAFPESEYSLEGLPEAEILVIREVKHHVYVKRQT